MGAEGDKIITEISLNIAEFAKALNAADGMAKTLKSTLGQIASINLDKDGNLTKSTRGFKGDLDGTNSSLLTGEQRLRGFYREQRLQDRTIREASQALIGFTVGLSSMISSSDGGSESTKRFTSSLMMGIATMQGAEFSAAALSIAGRNLRGSLGQVAGFLGKNAGMIGAVIGIGAGLIAFFRQADEEARKAAQGGLTDFETKLKNLSPGDRAKTLEAIKNELDIEKNKPTRHVKITPYGIKVTKLQGPDAERISILEEMKDRTTKAIKEQPILDQVIQTTRDTLAKTGTDVQKIDLQLEELNKLKQKGLTTDTNGKKIADEIAGLERQKKTLTQSTDDALGEQVKKVKSLYDTGQMTTAQYLQQMQTIQSGMQDKQKSADLEKEILDFKQKQVEAEGSRNLKAKEFQINTKKEILLAEMDIDQAIITAHANSEAEKLNITRIFALRRIDVEEDAQLKTLKAQEETLTNLIAATQNADKKLELIASRKLNQETQASTTASASTRRAGVQSTYDLGMGSMGKGIMDAFADDTTQKGSKDVARLASTRSLNTALYNEQKHLADQERALLNSKDAAEQEALAKQRQITLDKIALYEDELKAREEVAQQGILAGIQEYDASKSLAANMAGIARQIIKQEIAKAVASQIAKVISSIPWPFNLVAAPIAGMAAAALFESIVPQFAIGGRVTKATLGMVGEAGPEIIAPEGSFYDVARRQMIPRILEIAKRDIVRHDAATQSVPGTMTNMNFDTTQLIAKMSSLETTMKGIVNAIAEMPAPVVDNRNAVIFRQAFKDELPIAMKHFRTKYPDS